MPAVPVHHTATSDDPWDGPAQVVNIPSDATAAVLGDVFAWTPGGEDLSKSACKLPHHFVSAGGKPGAASVKGCSAAVGALNGGRGGTDIPDGDRQGVFRHLVTHLKDAGVKPDDLPELKGTSVEEAEAFAAVVAEVYADPEGFTQVAAAAGEAAAAVEDLADAARGALDTAPREVVVDGRRYVYAGFAPTDKAQAPLPPSPGAPEPDGDEAGGPSDHDGDEPGEEGDHSGGHIHFHIPVGVVEGAPTSDHREITPMAVTYRTPPIPLKSTIHSAHGNVPTTDPVVIGRVDHLERRPVVGEDDGRGGTYPDGSYAVFGHGTFDTSDLAQEHARMIHNYMHNGVSADIGNAMADVEPMFDDAGEMVGETETLTSGELMAFTVVPMPAFAGCYIVCADKDGGPMPAPWLATGDEGSPAPSPADAAPAGVVASANWTVIDSPAVGVRSCGPCERGETLVASAGPVAPPTAWFLDPQLSEPTPLTITADGRIYGHMALWGVCHTGISGRCQDPPRGGNYAYYRTGAVLTAEQDLIPTGRITLAAEHAPQHLRAAPASAHYENTATAVADVAAGEDKHGIWFAGAMRPDVSDEQVRALRASPLSGDWRQIGGRLELVACLAVNVPGFPVPRAVLAGGQMITLTAAGAPGMAAFARSRTAGVDPAELDELRGRLAAQEKASGRVLRVGAEAMRARVHRGVA